MTVNPHLSPAFFFQDRWGAVGVPVNTDRWREPIRSIKLTQCLRLLEEEPPPRHPTDSQYSTSATAAQRRPRPRITAVAVFYHTSVTGSSPLLQLVQAFFPPVPLILLWRRSEACRDEFFIPLPRTAVSRFCELLLDNKTQNAAVIYSHWGCCCVVRQITQWSDVLAYFFFFFPSINLVFLSVTQIVFCSLEQYLGTLL